MEVGTDHGNDSDDANGDGEGVWSPDIEQCFREALLLFPPCGRRKHILQEEGGGKMYGRNELIARHIMMRTGKVRTRKQVSSHIQVLARRKAKAEAAAAGGSGVSPSPSEGVRSQSVGSIGQRPIESVDMAMVVGEPDEIWMDRAIVTHQIRLVHFSAFIEHRNDFQMQQQLTAHQPQHQLHQQPQHQHQQHQQQQQNQYQQQQRSLGGFIRHSYVQIDYSLAPQASQRTSQNNNSVKLECINISQIQDKFPDVDGSDGLFQRGPSDAFFLVKFWADISDDYEYNIQDQNAFFGFSSHFETVDRFEDITCSTKVCSYGKKVIEQVEKVYGAFNNINKRYSYNIARSPMCSFMVHFIKKLRQLPHISQMNSVLENFTVLQVVTCESTSEILLCLAYVFEVAPREQNLSRQYHVYRLTNGG